jgi:hypothetical protein
LSFNPFNLNSLFTILINLHSISTRVFLSYGITTTWLAQEKPETTMSPKSFMVFHREHVLLLKGVKDLAEVRCVKKEIECALRREKLGEMFTKVVGGRFDET